MEGSQKEASEAKQQVLEICTKMRAGKVEGEKRKCAEDGAGEGSKKAKTDERAVPCSELQRRSAAATVVLRRKRNGKAARKALSMPFLLEGTWKVSPRF